MPALEGLSQRFRGPDASFLDIGVGVAGPAIAMAEEVPTSGSSASTCGHLRSDSHTRTSAKPACAIASSSENREPRQIEGDKAFDLAWMPLFMPERVIPAAAERTLRALRPGGWMVFAFANLDVPDEKTVALWRLLTTMFGGPLWLPSQVETLARDCGFTDVRSLPGPPGAPVALVVGRRSRV